MRDLNSTLQSLELLAGSYPTTTRVLVNGQPVQAIYFDSGSNGKLPSVRINTELPPHMKPVTSAHDLAAFRRLYE